MLYQLAKGLLLCVVLCGLCTPVLANTTASAPVSLYPAPMDIASPGSPLLPPLAAPTVADEVWARMQPARIALLLPLRTNALGAAAEAVRAGFVAAYQREPNGIEVDVVRTGDRPEQVVAGYRTASEQYDIVVGPLSRTGALAVAQEERIDKPTIVLNALDGPDGGTRQLPAKMLAIGLSIEDEARQAADWADADQDADKAYIVFTASPWQRRTANAFVARWRRLGHDAEAVEVDTIDGYLDWKPLRELKERIGGDPALLFAALDVWQTRQLREAVGAGIPLYGTSQLNPFVLAERATAPRLDILDGAYLLDLPWQLEADHPAVMIYPHQVTDADKTPSADMARLYALGIDAYRVAREIAGAHTDFELDGVTGKLSVRFDRDSAHFKRIESRAIYRGGEAVSIADPAQ